MKYFPQKGQLILELIIILTATTFIYQFSFFSMNYLLFAQLAIGNTQR